MPKMECPKCKYKSVCGNLCKGHSKDKKYLLLEIDGIIPISSYSNRD